MILNLTKSRLLFLAILAAMGVLGGYTVAKLWQASNSIFISGRNPISQLAGLVLDGNKLTGESKGQVNVLLLGVGGPGHDGPYLSDTIIVASVKPATSEISLISIPRDTHVSIPGDNSGTYKVNNAYAFGMAKDGEEKALKQARETVGNYLGIEIPYGVVIDFDGFSKAIDTVGGVDVNIPTGFTDSSFPNNKNGYLPPVTFKKGIEHMDGERALIYARSRHSTSDFDRAMRQQLIIEAFKQRVKELNLLTDLGTVNRLFSDFSGNVSTNLDAGQIRRLAQMVFKVPQSGIYSSVLDPNTGLVCSYTSTQKGYHINICPGKSKEDVYRFAETAFARGHINIEKPVAEIQNATGSAGYALSATGLIKPMGFTATTANAARLLDSSQTTVYDLTGGKKPNSLAVLLTTYSGKVGTGTPPMHNSATAPDFIVVLGKNFTPPVLDVINLDPPKPKPEETDEDDEATSDEDDEEEKTPAPTTKTPSTTTKPSTGTKTPTTTTPTTPKIPEATTPSTTSPSGT